MVDVVFVAIRTMVDVVVVVAIRTMVDVVVAVAIRTMVDKFSGKFFYFAF